MHTIETRKGLDDSHLRYVDSAKWDEFCVKWVNEYLRKSDNDISGLCEDLEISGDYGDMMALYESDNNEWYERIIARASLFKESQIQDLILDSEGVI